jgi:hypothetical protein
LLDIAFVIDITAELNEFNTALQGGNNTVINVNSTTDSFKEKPKLWKTQLMNSVLTYFPRVPSRADGVFDVSVCNLYIVKLLKGIWKKI